MVRAVFGSLWFWAVIWCTLCVVTFSDAGINTLLYLVTLVFAVIWGVLWLVRWVVRWRAPDTIRGMLSKSMWLIEMLCLTVPLVLAFSGTFYWMRFNLSEAALNHYVADVRAGKVDLAFEFNHPVRYVGLYAINYTDMLQDGSVRILTSSQGVMDRAGFVHSPSNPPPRQGEDSYRHIQQQWWNWHESW